MDVTKTMAVGDRIFAGTLGGGPSTGFTAANLKIEMLDPQAPVKEWWQVEPLTAPPLSYSRMV